MKRWKEIRKSYLAAAAAVILVIGAGTAVLLNASSLNTIFEPKDFERFENQYDDGKGYDSVAGDGEESDLADENEDGEDSADKDAQKALKVAEDETGDKERPGIADWQNRTGNPGQEENPDAFELVDNRGIGGIDVRPGDGGSGNPAGIGTNPGGDGNGGNTPDPGGQDGPSSPGGPGNQGRPGTSGKPGGPGGSDYPDRPGKPDDPDDPNQPDIPVNWEEEQLKPVIR